MSFRDVRSAENLFPKINRNDRYKQMTQQQQLIEEKKKQIQQKLEEKKKKKDAEEASSKAIPIDTKIERKPLVFSNDGSFLDQFKKISGITGSQTNSTENESPDKKSSDVENNNQLNKAGEEQAVEEEVKQAPALPPPLPPDRPPLSYHPQQHYPPPYIPFGVPPPPPPVPPPLIPPPLIPQSAPPPLAPQSIPPPRPINVQNIPPPPLHPSFPPPLVQFQPPPPGPPMPNLMLPPPNYNPPQVPPDNVQQGAAPACLAPVPQPPPQDLFPPTSHPPEQPSTNNSNWFPPRPPSSSNTNPIPPLMQELILEPRNESKEEFNNGQNASRANDRKRKSRWSDEKAPVKPVDIVSSVPKIRVTGMSGHMLTKVTRTDPGLLQYALTAYGSTSLTEEDWKKAEENYKVHLLYQDMMQKRAALEKLKEAGKHKYEYDSDEEIDEKGTWEHKLRDKEMMATQEWAASLTEMAKGKHHIGDFLPPDELKKFMAKYQAVKGGGEPDLSDYKEYKLGEENKGFQMLQKLGWSEGQGLGSDGAGRLDPINKGQMREFNEGLGHTRPDDISTGDDEYDAYRKRMMLAYRFRPNPLNNPRRPYY